MASNVVTQKQLLKYLLVTSLVAISIGGWLLHLRIHPIGDKYANFVPAAAGVVSIFVVPFLFLFKKTLPFAYVITGIIAIVGTITMGDMSIGLLEEKGVSLANIFFQTLFADILILWAKFFIAKAVFELELLHSDDQPRRTGRFFRYPNMGYWLVHLAAIGAVYALGHALWR